MSAFAKELCMVLTGRYKAVVKRYKSSLFHKYMTRDKAAKNA
jgi:hypothetical protein